MDLPNVTQIREIASRHGISPSKALGQNFVIDPNTIRKLIKLADIQADDLVVEVGPGLGALTLGLSEAAAEVVGVELDRHLIPALTEIVGDRSNVSIVHYDAMTYDFSKTFDGRSHRFVSNLPYNIATPLIAGILEDHPPVRDLVVMVQAEVGERLAAPPGSRTYGSISVLVAYYCDAKILGRVPPTVFWPPPKVDSVLLRLTRKPPAVEVDPKALMKVVRGAFSQRRKTIRNSLSSSLGLEPLVVETVLRDVGIPDGSRAEVLGLPEFADLTNRLEGWS